MALYPGPAPSRGKFVTGSTMRHILVMTGSSTLGLMAVFLVDFADLYFLSLLGEVEVAAAIGYAGSVLFFTIAMGIGLSVATTALVAPALGAGKNARARRRAVNVLLFTAVVTALLAVGLYLAIPGILTLLGAEGRAFSLAKSYLQIVVPSTPLLALAMCSAAALRAAGDAKRSMYVTLNGAIVNAVLDPLLIFGLGLGVDGAALASAAARLTMFLVGVHALVRIHRLLARPRLERVWPDASAILGIALPAVLTNIATPVANAYVTAAMAPFGDSAVAGWAVLSRLIPVAFAGVFALSGAVGPVLGQNLGAREIGRVRQSFTNALIFTAGYSLVVWGALALGQQFVISGFNASGDAAALIGFFCSWLSPAFGMFGMLFVSNAAFNNLGRPHYATMFNWGRATLGTILPTYAGAKLFGAYGVLSGQMLGGVAFGMLAVATCYLLINTLERKSTIPPVTGKSRGAAP